VGGFLVSGALRLVLVVEEELFDSVNGRDRIYYIIKMRNDSNH